MDKEQVPSVRLVNFGANTLEIELQFWSRNVFYIEQTKSETRIAVLEHFRATGISPIPVPSATLHVPEVV
ncbi:MAG: hypothetical protein ABI599_04625, partial [Flavobacteriales bacterium]